jgi:multiple sugar transport system substrate-binding protein
MRANKKGLSRRDFLRSAAAAAGAAVAAPLLKAEAAGGMSAPAARLPALRQASGKVTFWQHFGGVGRPELTMELIEEYKEVEPDLDIEYQTTPIAEYDQRLLTTLAAGSASDMFAIGDWNFALYLSNGWLAPADPAVFKVADTAALVDLYLPSSLVALVVDDKLYGIPNEYNVLHTYYRADQFVEVGLDPMTPPTTWEQMGEYGEALTVRQGDVMTRAGFQWPNRPPMSTEWTLKQFHPLIYQLGGDILNEDLTECTLNSEEGQRAAQMVLDYYAKYKCSEVGYTLTDKNPEFWQGRSSMDLQGPWGAGLGKATDRELYDGYPDTWAVANYPDWGDDTVRKMSPLWRWAYVVNSASDMQNEAWGFIDFLSQHQLRWLFDVGDIPCRKGWEDDPSLADLPWLPIQLADFAYGVPVPQTPKYFEMLEMFAQGIERIIAEEGNVKGSLDEATERINEILAAE